MSSTMDIIELKRLINRYLKSTGIVIEREESILNDILKFNLTKKQVVEILKGIKANISFFNKEFPIYGRTVGNFFSYGMVAMYVPSLLGVGSRERVRIIQEYKAILAKQEYNKDCVPTKIDKPIDSTSIKDNTSDDEFLQEINNLIGLEKIKSEILDLQSLAIIRKARIQNGLRVTPTTLHLVFSGNPGTGKTTVARLLGNIYHKIGLLKEKKVVEVSRTDLVAEYVGQTAIKTQNVFESAIGGILFIDEAYSLFKGGNDFGQEAVETLLKLMEDKREEIVIILAGYKKEIEDLLGSNPGLSSRFPTHLHFDDYTVDELWMIFNKMVLDYDNNLTKEAEIKIKKLIKECYGKGYFNSNGRAVRNLFESIVKKQSVRLSGKKDITKEDLRIFSEEDIPSKLSD